MTAAALRIAFFLAATGAVATCSGPSAQFKTELHRQDETAPFPVMLSDETALVTGIEPAPMNPTGDLGPVVRADPIDPNAFIVSWVGGACDNDASLTFKVSEGVYELNVAVHSRFSFPGGCTAVGIPRDVKIVTSSPIPVDSIVAAGRT